MHTTSDCGVYALKGLWDVQNKFSDGFRADYSDKLCGDFSLCYPHGRTASFCGGRDCSEINASCCTVLHFGIKIITECEKAAFNVMIKDSQQNILQKDFEISANLWQEFEIDLHGTALLTESIVSCRFSVPAEYTLLKLDKIAFADEDGNYKIGITHRSLEECRSDYEKTLELRRNRALRAGAEENLYEALKYFLMMYTQTNTKRANDWFVNEFQSFDEQKTHNSFLFDEWSLLATPLLIRMYYYCGKNGTLYPETKKALLEELWRRTALKNDIHLAKQNTWWMTGSENHDLNAKVCNLISAQIFMHEPQYRDRIYPDPGHGGGHGYWFRYMYLKKGDCGPDSLGHFSDGQQYRAKEHFEAWRDFLSEYITERVKKGFFLECASHGYMKWTLSFISLIYECCEDEKLRRKSRDFLDLIWLEWAQDSLSLRRGGAKTRAVCASEPMYLDSMYVMAVYLLGGEGNARHNYYFQLLSDYTLPDEVILMAMNRDALGRYEYISVKPGEEKPREVRPEGTERTLLCDCERSRFLRYSYVTPHFIMGTQMDSPMAVHSHLSNAMRWQGIIFSGSEKAVLYPCALPSNGEKLMPVLRPYRSVQYKNVLITQQARSWTQIDPMWYPTRSTDSLDFGVSLPLCAKEFVEEDGWIFLREQSAFAAVRAVFGGYQFFDQFADFARFVKLGNRFSPVIIEAAEGSTDKEWSLFRENIKSRKITLTETVVPDTFLLCYTASDGVEIYFNAANNEPPKIGGNSVNYTPDNVFQSPYLQSGFGSGIVTVSLYGKTRYYDFNQ